MKSKTENDPRFETIRMMQEQLIAEGKMPRVLGQHHDLGNTLEERNSVRNAAGPKTNDTLDSLLIQLGRELEESSDLSYSYTHMVEQVAGGIPEPKALEDAKGEPSMDPLTVMDKIRGLIEFAARVSERNRRTSARLVSVVQG